VWFFLVAFFVAVAADCDVSVIHFDGGFVGAMLSWVASWTSAISKLST
jgi:hypothetical protein